MRVEAAPATLLPQPGTVYAPTSSHRAGVGLSTSPSALRAWIQRLRAAGVERRLALTLSLSSDVIRASRHYGKELSGSTGAAVPSPANLHHLRILWASGGDCAGSVPA